jgi:hypothetical protein
MTILKKLNERYLNIIGSENVSLKLDFINDLLLDNNEKIISYHYSLLKDKQDLQFFQYIRNSFKKRGNRGITFLLNRIKIETNNELKSEALFILDNIEYYLPDFF